MLTMYMVDGQCDKMTPSVFKQSHDDPEKLFNLIHPSTLRALTHCGRRLSLVCGYGHNDPFMLFFSEFIYNTTLPFNALNIEFDSQQTASV